MNQKLIFTNLVGGAIDALVDELGAKDVFVSLLQFHLRVN